VSDLVDKPGNGQRLRFRSDDDQHTRKLIAPEIARKKRYCA
jgi:hypothetical protein